MSLRSQVRRALGGSPQWVRYAEARAIDDYLARLDPAAMDGAGITDGPGDRPWRTWTEFRYPELDLCAPPADLPTFDLVMCQHVLEHVVDPIAATRTLHRMLRPGGHLIVVTPFLVKIHNDPRDLWRFTPDGMRTLLAAAGFDDVETGSWGNSWVVAANLRVFVAARPWVHRLGRWTFAENPATPVAVWAFARR